MHLELPYTRASAYVRNGYNFFTIHGNNSKFDLELPVHVYLCNKNNDAIIMVIKKFLIVYSAVAQIERIVFSLTCSVVPLATAHEI